MTEHLPGGFVLEDPEKAGPVPLGLPSSFKHLTLPLSGDRKADPLIVANTAINVKRGLPMLQLENFKPKAPAIIVGGGPSLADTLDELRELAAEPDACIVCANDSHDFLIKNGIVPHYCIFWEVESSAFADFFANARDDVTYLLSAFAHPTAFEKLAGKNVVMFFATQFVGDEKIIHDYMREHGSQAYCGGAATAPLRAVAIMLCKGYLRFHLFGVDSSFRNGQSHAYYNREKAGLPIWCEGKEFDTNWYLAKQAENFSQYLKNYSDRYRFVVHGDGLIPHIARQRGCHYDQWKSGCYSTEYDLDADGFTILRGAIHPTTIRAIKARARSILGGGLDDDLAVLCAKGAERGWLHYARALAETPAALSVGSIKPVRARLDAAFQQGYVNTDNSAFYNDPAYPVLAYDWHSERSYFPDEPEVLSVWFPWLHDVGVENGTMQIARGSHKGDFAVDVTEVYDGLTQRRVADADLTAYEKIDCNLKVGDVVIFNRRVVHRTLPNTSGAARTAMVLRFKGKPC